MKPRLANLILALSLTLPWVTLQLLAQPHHAQSNQQCEVNEDRTGCKTQNADCTTANGTRGTCQTVANYRNPCKCDPPSTRLY